MKVQPIDIESRAEKETAPARAEPVKPVLKSLFKRIFDRPFPSALRTPAADKPSIGETQSSNKDGATELEPSSICLDKMVQNFIEDNHYNKQPAPSKYGRSRCNCFNGNSNDSADDEFDVFGESSNGRSPPSDACEALKSLVQCATVVERNLLADTAMIVENNKNCKRKDDLRKIVTDGLVSLGYNSSICKSKWDKSPSFPAGDYQYIDAIFVEEGRMLIDVDFRSEFEMARSTGTYKAIVQSLPFIFVGKPDRLDRIVSIVSEAAKQSLKHKGMHLPPWRKVDYMRAKWISKFSRASSQTDDVSDKADVKEKIVSGDGGELDLIFGDEKTASSVEDNEGQALIVRTWQPPAVKPKSGERGTKMATGLACLLKEKP